MKFELKCHRCFKIPRAKLDLFLVALDVNFSCESIKHQMDCVFMADDRFYDVIVAQYGTYPYVERQLEEFVNSMSEAE